MLIYKGTYSNEFSPKGLTDMLEQVELKIQELKKLRAQEYYKKKDADLKAWGLTTKVDGKKVTPIIVTDDEYEELVKASNGVGKVGRNSVANLLNILSVAIIIIGCIVGIVVADLFADFAVVSFTLALVISAIVSVIFRGIAEAIRLLQQLIDGRTLERPDPAAVKKPQVKKAVQKPAAAQTPMYVPYPAQGQSYMYPYPVYAAPAQAPAQTSQPAAYTPESLQAYYQQPYQPPVKEDEE